MHVSIYIHQANSSTVSLDRLGRFKNLEYILTIPLNKRITTGNAVIVRRGIIWEFRRHIEGLQRKKGTKMRTEGINCGCEVESNSKKIRVRALEAGSALRQAEKRVCVQ